MAPLASISVLKQDIGETSCINALEVRDLLSADELDRAERFKFDIHRFRFIRGRAFLRQTLAELLDQSPESIEFDYGRNGKPELDGGLKFNLSHSSDLAILAYTFDLDGLGIDIEILDRKIEFAGLTEHYFTEDERRWVLAPFLQHEEQKQRFFQVWTAKEARMKLYGEGMLLDPRSIHIKFENSKPNGYSAPSPTHVPMQTINMDDDNAIISIAATNDFVVNFV